MDVVEFLLRNIIHAVNSYAYQNNCCVRDSVASYE